MGLRLAFMGSPEFAVPSLVALVNSGFDVVRVYTQPPRPSGRGKKLIPTAVNIAANEFNIEVHTPVTLKSEEEQREFRMLDLDAAVVVAYGLMLPEPIVNMPRLGCINIHASLLPRWRGAAPIQRAIMSGDTETGISIMALDKGLDTGPILLKQAIQIGLSETNGELEGRLATLGAEMLKKALAGLAEDKLIGQVQLEKGATYADKLKPADEKLDWARSASELNRQIRALAPRPGAWFSYKGERIKVLKCSIFQGKPDYIGDPGEVIDARLSVACGEGVLRIERLQRAGRNAMDVVSFLQGQPMVPGTRLF